MEQGNKSSNFLSGEPKEIGISQRENYGKQHCKGVYELLGSPSELYKHGTDLIQCIKDLEN